MSKANVGLIGIVSELARDDFWGTMAQVAAIGYRGIEAPGRLLEGDVAENVKRFHGLGLQVLTIGASREAVRDHLSQVTQQAKSLGAPRVTVWWGPCDDRDALLRDAEMYNAAGRQLAQDGIQLCYHNHGHEFQTTYDGLYALDMLVANTDPRALAFEIDIAWVAFGGENPIAVLRRLAGRVPAIHVKDMHSLNDKHAFTAVGTGVVPVRESVQTAIELGIEWVVVEQDRLRNLTAMETATVSFLNLKEYGLV
ncbi:MAG TPA: sugar phosphate isomerase/epimerase [Tepidisphaeraceae bacterium]|jgi:sugar phosphate isomerase/epimerase|nr:sugar phosphate isomerase/epimerase [Tepidisphaeraceae bacterium]